MLPYLLLFSFFALGALFARPANAGQQQINAPFAWRPMLAIGALLIASMIGLRFRVGADWFNYIALFASTASLEFGDVLTRDDPGYQLLNWTAHRLGLEVWFVNLVSGLIFSWGLLRFARSQPNSWLVIVVAIPYLVTVVAMGYTRQAVAIGVLMAGLASRLQGGSMIKLAAYIVAAALFHKTAVVAYPLLAFGTTDRTRFVNFLIVLALGFLFYDFFLSDSLATYAENYLVAAYQSEGAAIRLGMSVLPAGLFLLWPNRFGFPTQERLIWRSFSFSVLVLLFLLFVLPSTTAVDRMALYVIPLQLAVLARLPGTLLTWRWGTVVVISYSFAVQAVWLNYASHARFWVPYRLYPL